MPSHEEFLTDFNRYEKEAIDFLENELLPTDQVTPSFINYFNSFGYFIDKTFSNIPTKFLQKIEKIFTDLFLSFTNYDGNNEKLFDILFTNFEEAELILNEALQIQSNINVYRTEAQDFFKKRRLLQALVDDRKKTERLKQKEHEMFQNLLEKSKQDAAEVENIRTRLKNEMDEIRVRYKDDLANFEIKKQSVTFRETAISNKNASYFWGVVIVLLLILLVIFSFIFIASCWKDTCTIFSTYSKEPQEFLRTLFYTDLGKKILLRLFLLSMLVFLLKYAMKHFNALMHNYTINTHKANSLDAVRWIFDSITNETTREQVITIAAKEIFTQQKTGYLSKEEGNLDFNALRKISSLFNKK